MTDPAQSIPPIVGVSTGPGGPTFLPEAAGPGMAAWEQAVARWTGRRLRCRHLPGPAPYLCAGHPDTLRCLRCFERHVRRSHTPGNLQDRVCDCCGRLEPVPIRQATLHAHGASCLEATGEDRVVLDFQMCGRCYAGAALTN